MKLGRTPKWMADWQLLSSRLRQDFFWVSQSLPTAQIFVEMRSCPAIMGNGMPSRPIQRPFIVLAPQQGYGADQQLLKDSLMKVINLSFGYCKVQLQNGRAAYVASEDIKPASVELVARLLAPVTTVDREAATTSDHFRLNSGDLRLIAPPEPLSETSATPEFGY
jgi:hypothetical protein